jgi:phosphopantothenoylcysteine decarboxylase/phosphopantothenate--cysteine ligase
VLQKKKIIVGVCGSIAAYKAAVFIRLLIKQGAEVRVVMTASASDFITPLTLATVAKSPALSKFEKNKDGEWNNHVELGLWADLLVIAPATANTIGKMANGLCDNLLLATYLSARCPVLIAPAMDLDMYQHPAVKKNIESLISFGNQIIHAEYGELASGLVGTGRMAEPEHIVSFIKDGFLESMDLTGKNVLITAGPTHEAIDPVRFIGNHSSGKMGYAIAEEMAGRGAKVHLVSGPSSQKISHGNIYKVNVNSANQMYEACSEVFASSDIVVLSAAVADYKPSVYFDQKVKKKDEELQISLVKTIDIAASLGKEKKDGQIIVGFALETENEIDNAGQKLDKKNFDFIVLNSLNDQGAGFGHDTNKITIIDRDNKPKKFKLKSKKEVATDIVNEVVTHINR